MMGIWTGLERRRLRLCSLFACALSVCVRCFVRTDGTVDGLCCDTRYEIAAGHAHLRRGELPAALQKFMSTESHFDVMIEDQFDFHGYCFRTGHCNLQAYVIDAVRGGRRV